MDKETIFSPAKINLFLAVTGRRNDGYHNLISWVAPVDFGDQLELARTEDGKIVLTCDCSIIPTDERNVIVRALLLFQETTGIQTGWRVHLRKRIPVGGGLGGGSSNATKVILAANRLLGFPLTEDELAILVSRIGSDCPAFLHQASCVIRGRGDVVEQVSPSVCQFYKGRKIALFWPIFPISTPWAFSCFDESVNGFSSISRSEENLRELLTARGSLDGPFQNDFEPVLGLKYPTIVTLLNALRKLDGVSCSVSGSGSSCFAFAEDESSFLTVESLVRSAWGAEAGFTLAKLL